MKWLLVLAFYLTFSLTDILLAGGWTEIDSIGGKVPTGTKVITYANNLYFVGNNFVVKTDMNYKVLSVLDSIEIKQEIDKNGNPYNVFATIGDYVIDSAGREYVFYLESHNIYRKDGEVWNKVDIKFPSGEIMNIVGMQDSTVMIYNTSNFMKITPSRADTFFIEIDNPFAIGMGKLLNIWNDTIFYRNWNYDLVRFYNGTYSILAVNQFEPIWDASFDIYVPHKDTIWFKVQDNNMFGRCRLWYSVNGVVDKIDLKAPGGPVNFMKKPVIMDLSFDSKDRIWINILEMDALLPSPPAPPPGTKLFWNEKGIWKMLPINELYKDSLSVGQMSCIGSKMYVNVYKCLKNKNVLLVYDEDIIGVEEQSDNKDFGIKQVYPNPANLSTNVLYTSSPLASEFPKVDIFDIYGSLAKKNAGSINGINQADGSGSLNVDLGGLAPGCYILKISIGGFVQARSVIVTK